jgi:catechol 2,3-dioxygenase-like lactoylglutathione lyase family enzyme
VKVTSLDHISIGTPRLEETKDFFCDVLGFEAGPRPRLKSTGYWLYANGAAMIHLVERAARAGDADPGPATAADMIETGTDDHVALTVSDAAGVVDKLKRAGVAYWDRLLADRNLYQVFIREPNGVILELNDYDPDHGRIDPMTVQGRQP